MNDAQIAQTLSQLFRSNRIVSWYDDGGEFDDTLKALNLDGVDIIRLDESGPFATKIRIEIDDQNGKYLIYAP